MATKFKIVLMGDSDVGKSAVLKRFVENAWSDEKPSNQDKGVYITKELVVNKTTVKFEIVDLAFDIEATASDFAGAKGCIAVFDWSSPDSIKNVRNFLGIATRFVDDDKFLKCIIGNKSDLEKKVEESTIKEVSETQHVTKVYNCSAKTGEGINEAFEDIAKTLIGEGGQDKGGKDKGGKTKGEKKGKGKCHFL